MCAVYLVSQFEGGRYYLLDDYVRFPTLKETFREYVPEVGVRKGEDNYKITLRLQNRTFNDNEYSSLILVDGLPISASRMFEISPYAVESIRVVNYAFYFGDVRLSGIISLKTFKGDYRGIDPKMNVTKYIGLQPLKVYIFTDHSIDSKLPDQRSQLFWNPEILVDKGDLEFDFYTSDVPGIYEIRVEGIGELGKSISLRKSIIVE